MPPIRPQFLQKRTEQVGRILLAIHAIQSKKLLQVTRQRVVLQYRKQPYVAASVVTCRFNVRKESTFQRILSIEKERKGKQVAGLRQGSYTFAGKALFSLTCLRRNDFPWKGRNDQHAFPIRKAR